LQPAVEAMCLWKTFVSSQCVRITMIVANILYLSPSPEPTTLSFLRSDGRRWSRSSLDLKFWVQHVNFFSLPPLVSRSSTRISQLISQIVQKRPKSGLHAGHSEVAPSRHVVWIDSILIEPNQRKKFKLASSLSGLLGDKNREIVVKWMVGVVGA